MSERVEPNIAETPTSSEKDDISSVSQPIPHSGQLGLEYPVNDYDKYIHEAVFEGLIETPEHPGALAEEQIAYPKTTPPDIRGRGLARRYIDSRTGKVITAGVGLGLAATAALTLGKSDEKVRSSDPVEVLDNGAPVSTTITTEASTTSTTTPELFGPNGFVSSIRPNGETVRVSRLPDFVGNTPQEIKLYAETANELLALYFTTGDEGILSEITANPNFQDDLRSSRDESFVKPYAILNVPTRPNFQMVIGKSPDHLVGYHTTTSPEGRMQIVNNTGNLVRFQFSDDPKWGSTENSSTEWKELYWDTLTYTIVNSGGKDVIYGVSWTYKQ